MRLNSSKIKPIAIAVIELRLSEGILREGVNQSVSQSVSRKIDCRKLFEMG